VIDAISAEKKIQPAPVFTTMRDKIHHLHPFPRFRFTTPARISCPEERVIEFRKEWQSACCRSSSRQKAELPVMAAFLT
jgi:hypothetical protein